MSQKEKKKHIFILDHSKFYSDWKRRGVHVLEAYMFWYRTAE